MKKKTTKPRKVKNLLNPTPAQVKYRARLWAEALLKNKHKAKGHMKVGEGRCCLQVAQDVAIACGVNVGVADKYSPVPSVSYFFGWGTTDPEISLPGDISRPAANVNDGIISTITENKKFLKEGLPHKLIAECVMNTYVHPSKKTWTFKL